jgi:hypothetical protein
MADATDPNPLNALAPGDWVIDPATATSIQEHSELEKLEALADKLAPLLWVRLEARLNERLALAAKHWRRGLE